MTQNPRRILGLDPGLRLMGWGVIDSIGNRLIHVAHGTVKVDPKQDLDLRLKDLFQGLTKVVKDFQPHEAAIEETFLNKNPSSTLKLGLARGVVMVVPTLYDIRVGEYSANHIKKNIVGAGHADKNQVKAMIGHLLPKSGEMSYDEADALAVAICHSHTLATQQKWKQVS